MDLPEFLIAESENKMTLNFYDNN